MPTASHLHALHRDARIALLAERQHGVVARRQLLDAGLTPSAVERRATNGQLHLWHRGVYAVGHRGLSRDGRWMAAVLAAGPGAALSHRSAAAALGLRPTSRTLIDVVSPRQPPERAGIHGHRVRVFRPDDRTIVRGIPVTSVARTLVDLAATVDARGLDRAWRRAEQLRTLDVVAVARQLRRGRAGSAALRRQLAVAADGVLAGTTRSELERLLLELVAAAGLPIPVMNGHVAGRDATYEVDALWVDRRLVVELDGWETHGLRDAFERDRRRDADLARVGFRVVRFTWKRVLTDPNAVATTLRELLR